MAGPKKRWQLLLVADDGRIVPFRRIKGIAVTLVVLLVLMGVVCAGLWWQLTAEKTRHGHVKKQLEEVDQQVAQYKSKHELMTAELVLAQARMEKAGLLPPKRQERIPKQKPVKLASSTPGPEPVKQNEKKSSPAPEVKIDTPSATAKQPPPQLKTTQTTEAGPKARPDESKVEASTKPGAALGDLEMRYNAGNKRLLSRFRVKNTGPRSSPVAGRCVVVLKNDWMDPKDWLTIPSVTMVGGKPDGSQGQAFKISNYKNITIKALVPVDPSSFKTATIHVFDPSGSQILEKDYPIDLPAPTPVPEMAPDPTDEKKSAGVTDVSTTHPPAPLKISPATAEKASETSPQRAEESVNNESASDSTPIVAPVDDPSLTDDAPQPKKEDNRARF